MLIKMCISDMYFSTNIKRETMQPLLLKIFVVKFPFQNAHVGNGSQGSEKEISIYLMKVVQADLSIVMKRQFEVLYRKCTIKQRLCGFQSQRYIAILIRCLGTAYIDRKALADQSYSMCFIACTTQGPVISEPYRHRR